MEKNLSHIDHTDEVLQEYILGVHVKNGGQIIYKL